MSKTERQAETNHSVLLTKTDSRIIWRVADETGLNPQEVFDQTLYTFIQIHEAIEKGASGASIVLKAGDFEYDLTGFFMSKDDKFEELKKATGIDLLSEVVTPRQDLEAIQQDFQARGIPLRVADSHIQDEARRLTQVASGRVIASYGWAMEDAQKARVQRLDQGVLVVDSLKGAVDDWADKIGFPKMGLFAGRKVRGLISGIIAAFTQPDGLSVDGTTTLLLQKRIFSPNVSESRRMQLVGREVLHVAGDSYLPIMLYEAMTDTLAARAISASEQTAYAMRGRNFTMAFKSLELIRSAAGSGRFLSAYFEPPMVEWRNQGFRFLAHPLHDFMRQDMGMDEEGRSHWDKFMHLAFQNRMIDAYSVLASN